MHGDSLKKQGAISLYPPKKDTVGAFVKTLLVREILVHEIDLGGDLHSVAEDHFSFFFRLGLLSLYRKNS